MSALSAVSTPLATKLALNLFFTPIKFPIPKRETPVRESATEYTMHTGKSEFSLFEWKNDGPKVLLVHGWGGRATQFFRIIEELHKKGYHVFSIEAPAHGTSKQRKTHMLEFVDCVETVQDKFGQFDFAIGHSLGGMAIFNSLLRNLSPHKIVVIGTPVSIRSVVNDFCEKVKATPKVANRIIENIENRYSMKVEDASTDDLASRFDPQGMIIHDTDDQDISVEQAKQLAAKWPNAQLVITQGLGHRKVLMDQKVIDSIIGFLPLN
ncbi:alpha/beta hydrolase [Owenweeksia hongkongensis]|uniref:alpha/beta hydrolase n=1 Tax=Owenweeksia hongkongensis TaxID=253245 RepID=UPI003A8F41CF